MLLRVEKQRQVLHEKMQQAAAAKIKPITQESQEQKLRTNEELKQQLEQQLKVRIKLVYVRVSVCVCVCRMCCFA